MTSFLKTSVCFIFMGEMALANPSLSPVPLDSSSSPDIEDLVDQKELEATLKAESKGDYPPLNRSLSTIQKAWNTSTEDAGVYHVTHSEHEVIRLRLREYMQTTIILPPWEKIDQILVGDDGLFVAQKIKSHILTIKPQMFVGADTNLTVTAQSGLVYTFYIRSEGANSKHTSDLVVYVRAGKPHMLPVSHITSKESGQKDWLEPVRLDLGALNFNFSMAGDSSIAPLRVFSNGFLTWFDYGEAIKTMSLPTISSMVDHVDTPVNVSRQGTSLVAQGVGPFTLRLGQKVVCVYPTK